jgi:hypothetical protein
LEISVRKLFLNNANFNLFALKRKPKSTVDFLS